MQVVEQRVGAQHREDAADAGDQHQVVLLRVGDLAEALGDLLLVQHAPQGLEQGVVSLVPLQLQGLVQELAFAAGSRG